MCAGDLACSPKFYYQNSLIWDSYISNFMEILKLSRQCLKTRADVFERFKYEITNHPLYYKLPEPLSQIPLLLINVREDVNKSFEFQCPICGYTHLRYNHYYYCHICGNELKYNDKKEGVKIMKYSEIEGVNGRLTKCLVCENEILVENADYCHICGSPIKNECACSDYNGNDLQCEESKINKLPLNARYCPYCGSATTFYIKNLLKDWEYEKSENELQESFDNGEILF